MSQNMLDFAKYYFTVFSNEEMSILMLTLGRYYNNMYHVNSMSY